MTPTNAPALPRGTVTFLFTDIQGSTSMVRALGDERWAALLATHHDVLRRAIAAHGGREVKTEGDAFFVAFASAAEAVAAAAEGQRGLAAHTWPEEAVIRVRMGLHTGEAAIVADDYVGLDVHRAARIAATGHGGQVVLSDSTRLLVEHALPAGVGLLDLSEHRLKDLNRPERIWQLQVEGLPASFPALNSLDATPNNLPTQLTSFVGREKVVAEARERLLGSRLLTLTGPGGTGKTRLSLQLAAEVSDLFGDGVYWVGLAPIDKPELVASAIAQVIGVQESTGHSPLELVERYLAPRTVLLVLDNFEQVLAGAAVVAEILKAAPGVKAMVTSRAPLRVYGEQEYPVPPMEVPDPRHLPPLESLAQFEAVRLFIERAVAVKPDFSVNNQNALAVAAIAALVDGLPLAIELAAARVRLLTPQAMLSRLQGRLGDLGVGARDLPARQQTLRGAIAWSYDLLEPGVRRLMDRLSVFAGGALVQIEAVCGPQSDLGINVFEGLETLVEQSLLRTIDDPEGPRFLMLNVIREFAADLLGLAADGDAVRTRHAETFLALVEEAAPNLIGADQNLWLDRLQREHDNLRTALAWFVSRGSAEEAARFVAATWRFWHIRGHLREARAKIDEVLAIAAGQPKALLRTLEAAGGIAWWQADIPACERYCQEALEFARQVGSDAEIAGALYNLSFPVAFDDADRSLGLARQAMAHYEAAGDVGAAARCRWGVANTLILARRWAEALEMAEEAARTFEAETSNFDLAWAMEVVGFASVRLGHALRGREALDRSLKLLMASGDVSGVPILLGGYADLAALLGDGERALRLQGASEALEAESGAGLAGISQDSEGRLPISPELESERGAALRDEGRRMTLKQAIAYAAEQDLPAGAP